MFVIIGMEKGRPKIGQGVSESRSEIGNELNMRTKQKNSRFCLLRGKGADSSLFLDAYYRR